MRRKQPIATISAGFPALLGEIKNRVREAQTRAIFAANAELVRLYWDIGHLIDRRQKAQGWGAAVIPRLSKALRAEFPEMKGFSERNIKSMLAFHRAYPDPDRIVQQAAAQLPDAALWSIPWYHHIVLIEKIKDLPTRLWYMQQTLANGWSRNILLAMIQSGAHRRQGKAITNFDRLLSPPQSDLAHQTLKDPYVFDFLTLTEPFRERELEIGLLRQLERFLLELGQGFAFVGRQLKLDVGDSEYFVDLLFYHLKLRCFVVIELKTGEFKPEYAGKMNFYLGVVDDKLRHAADSPSIGLILCQDRNHIVAEYALRGVSKPIGVSGYELTRALPAKLRSSLPTVEEIESELRGASKPKNTAGPKNPPKPRRK